MERPKVICHILQSIDGKIAGSFFGAPGVAALAGAYARLGESFEADAVVYGTTTLDEIFTHGFRPQLDGARVRGGSGDFVGTCDAKRYLIAIDPKGALGWTSPKPQGRPALADAHIVEVLCEGVDEAYLAHLESLGISYIFAGAERLDLSCAMEKLARYFGIKRVLLQGGGLVDGSFAYEGLVDELSIVVAPVVDSSSDQPTSFETGDFLDGPIAPLAFKLKEAQRLEGDGLWLRYER